MRNGFLYTFLISTIDSKEAVENITDRPIYPSSSAT